MTRTSLSPASKLDNSARTRLCIRRLPKPGVLQQVFVLPAAAGTLTVSNISIGFCNEEDEEDADFFGAVKVRTDVQMFKGVLRAAGYIVRPSRMACHADTAVCGVACWAWLQWKTHLVAVSQRALPTPTMLDHTKVVGGVFFCCDVCRWCV
jgi:hypothetical protein